MNSKSTSRSVHQEAKNAPNDDTAEVRRDGEGYHPGDLVRETRAYLAERGISETFADKLLAEHWVETWDGLERCREREREREYKLDAAYPHLPVHPLPGMLLAYQKCEDEWPRFRIRYFETEYTEAGTNEGSRQDEETVEVGRWSAQAKPVTAQAYLRAVLRAAWQDVSVPIVIVEAPIKALALAQYGEAALGKAGADAGLHDPSHPERLAREASRITWRGRTVYLMMDSGQLRNPDVARGVGRDWALLSAAGADVRICYLPEKVATSNFSDPKSYDQGPDDWLAGVYQRNLNRLSERLVAGTVRENLTDEQQEAEEERIERQARWFAKLALHRLLRRAKPGNPWDRIQQEGDNKEALLRELPFLACLRSSGEAGLARAARAWGRGGKGLLKAALVDSQAAEMKGEEQVAYRVLDGALQWGKTQLTSFYAEITEEVHHDDGDERELYFRLRGALASGTELPEIKIPASEYERMDWVVTRWGARACIQAGRGTKDHTRAAIQTLSKPIRRTVYTASGWRELAGKWVFLLPGGGIGPDGPVDVEVSSDGLVRYKLPPLPKDDEHALRAVEKSLSAVGVCGARGAVASLLAMTYAAPLEPLLTQGVNLTLWIRGDSGSRKSSVVAAIGQSHFGEFSVGEDLTGTWDATKTALEGQMHRAAHVIYTIDNYVTPDTDGPERRKMVDLAKQTIQNRGDRTGRQRCNRDAQERVVKIPRAAVVATAEILPPDGDSTMGRSFIVEIDSEKSPVSLHDLSHFQDSEVQELLQTAMGGYLRWLAQQDRSTLEMELNGYRVGIRDEVRPLLGGAHGRVPSNVGVLLTGVWAWTRYAKAVGMAPERVETVRAKFKEWVLSAAKAQPRAVHVRPLERFLDAVRTMIRTGAAALCSGPEQSLQSTPDSQYIGWVDGEDVLLHPTATVQAVRKYLGEKWAVSDTELGDQLRKSTTVEDVGTIPVLRETDGSRTTCRRRVGGGRTRVWVVDRRILADVTYEGLRPVAAPEWTQEDEDSLVDEM